jgi:hypothetical protein
MSVYALRDPRTGACRYVGHSRAPMARIRRHLRFSHSGRVRAWNQELRTLGLVPSFELLGPGTEAEWMERLHPDLNINPGEEFVREDKRYTEIKMRARTLRQKTAFENAAKRHQPELSLNQWLLAAALEKLEREKGGKR